MYLMISSRCNMSCAHCCYNCTTKGEDMSIRTFKRIINYHQPDLICLGGGEPTLHPRFWEMLGLSIASCESVWLATNGSITKTALALAKMAQSGVIGCALSQDQWHDPIDNRVVQAFKRDIYSLDNDCREIRTIKNPYNNGRCDFGRDGCACEELFVLPNGNIKQCGCLESPVIGSVFDKSFAMPEIVEYTCFKESKDSELLEEA